MSKFTEALNSPLPSKVNTDNILTESEDIDEINEEGCEGKVCEDVDSDDLEDISASDDGFDPDSMSDEELADLDAELGDDVLDDVIGDDDEEVSLSPEEEIEADDMMKVAATTLLVNDELSVEEKAEFVKTEAVTAVNEGFMTEADVNEMAVEAGVVQEGNNYNKKMIIRLDAESKKKQLYALAVNVSAAAHNDPDYIKLKKVMKMRKVLRAKLDRKYHGEATKRMKIYFNRLRNSKAQSLAKTGKKYSK